MPEVTSEQINRSVQNTARCPMPSTTHTPMQQSKIYTYISIRAKETIIFKTVLEEF